MIKPEEMMDEFDRWAIQLLEIMAAVLLVILCLLVIAWWLEPPPARPTPPQPTEAERRHIAMRHEYHGIPGNIVENGQHYFYRDGKRCKL